MDLESQPDQEDDSNGYRQHLPGTTASMHEEKDFQSADEERENEHETIHEEKNIMDKHHTFNAERSSHNSGYLDPIQNAGVESGGFQKPTQSVETISDEGYNTDERGESNKSGGLNSQTGIQNPLCGRYIHPGIQGPFDGEYIPQGIKNTLDGVSGNYSYIHDSRLLEGDQLENAQGKDGGYEYIPVDIGDCPVDGSRRRSPVEGNSNNAGRTSTTNEHDEEDNTYQSLRRRKQERKKLQSCFHQHKITFTIIFATLLTCVISTVIAISVTMFMVKKEDLKLTPTPVVQTSSPFTLTLTPSQANNIYTSSFTTTSLSAVPGPGQDVTTTAKLHETGTASHKPVTEQPNPTTTEYMPPPLKGRFIDKVEIVIDFNKAFDKVLYKL